MAANGTTTRRGYGAKHQAERKRLAPMRVRCARCGEVWDEDDLRRLGLVLES